MRERSLTVPEIGFIAGTRFALGVGLGLLIADKADRETRKTVGWGLVAIGALTMIPIGLLLFCQRQRTNRE